MKIHELITRLDKSVGNFESVNTHELGYEMGLYDIPHDFEQTRLASYWIGEWMCTDTVVGYKAYFLDNEFVAFSKQVGRKCDEEFEWASNEKAVEVKKYLISLMEEPSVEFSGVLLDMSAEVGDGYGIDFNGNLWGHKVAFLESGEKVEIIERIKNVEYIDTHLKVRGEDGTETIVDITKLVFPFNLKSE